MGWPAANFVAASNTGEQRRSLRSSEALGCEGLKGQGRNAIVSLPGEPGVAALHDTHGRCDLLAELSQVLERLQQIRGIRGSETGIWSSSHP